MMRPQGKACKGFEAGDDTAQEEKRKRWKRGSKSTYFSTNENFTSPVLGKRRD